MMLTLVAAACVKERHICKVNPRAVKMFQFQPDLFAFFRGEFRMPIHFRLEMVYKTSVGDKIKSGFQLILVKFFCTAFPKEQFIPGAGEQLHGHGVCFGSIHGWAAHFEKRDTAQGKVTCKSVARLMRQDFHVASSAVEI